MDGCVFVKCYLIFMYVNFSDFQVVGCRLGLSPRKWLINRFSGVGWGGVMGFEGDGVGDTVQTQGSPDFRSQEVHVIHLGARG